MVKVATGQLTIYDQNDSKQAQLYIAPSLSNQVIFDGIVTYNPLYSAGTKQILTPEVSIAGSSTDMSANVTATRWYYQVNSTGSKVEITAGAPYAGHALTQVGIFPLLKSLDISTNVVAANTSMRYTCEIDYLDPDTTLSITMVGDFQILKIATGVTAYVGYLTNTGSGIPCDMAGTVLSYTGAVATFSVMRGAVVDTGWTISKTFLYCGDVETDEAASVATSKTTTINSITQAAATVTFTATKTNYTTITSVFNIFKIQNGVDSKVYEIVLSANGLNKSELNVYNPTTVTISAQSIQGNAAPVAYSSYFKVHEATEAAPGTYVQKYVSTANEASKVYTPTSTAGSIKVELFQAGGATVLLDTETITITKNGFDAAYLQVWIPEGNDVKNSVGTVKVKADMYKGGLAVTPTAWAWYYLNDSSVWTIFDINNVALGVTNYTTATITVPAAFIEGTENFKCVATYNAIQYSNVATVRVIDDPIICEISGGNVIRNGANSLSLTAKVLREGVDIDPGGTLYAYEWNLLNPTTLAVVFDIVADTKNVTVAPADFVGMAVAQCVATEKP